MRRKELLIERFTSLGYKLITSDNYNIANRIEKYDKDLVLFFNPFRKRYEVHTSFFFPSKKPTYCVGSPYLDSELVVRQLNGEYKVKELNIQDYFIQIWNLRMDFGKTTFHHIPRERNAEADRLVNIKLDEDGSRLQI